MWVSEVLLMSFIFMLKGNAQAQSPVKIHEAVPLGYVNFMYFDFNTLFTLFCIDKKMTCFKRGP